MAKRIKIADLQAEVNQARNEFEAFKGKLRKQQAMVAKVSAHSEAEVKRLQQEPQSEHRDQQLRVYQLRHLLSERAREICQVLIDFNVDAPNAERTQQSQQAQIKRLKTEVRYLSTEFSVANYAPIVRDIESGQAGGSTGRLGSGRLGSGPLGGKTGTGRLGATGPLGNKPGLGRPGTGPLKGPTGPLGGSSGPLKGGTGPLSQAQAAATTVQTGPLRAQQEAGQPAAPERQARREAVAKLAAQPGGRENLKAVVEQYQEIERLLGELRGEELGQIGVPAEQLEAELNKVAGKIYYMKRAIEQLGPAGAPLAFEADNSDQELEMFLMSQQDAKPEEGGGLVKKLKSFLNM